MAVQYKMARSDKYFPVGISSVLSELCFVPSVVVIVDDELFDLYVKPFPVNPLIVTLPLSAGSPSGVTRFNDLKRIFNYLATSNVCNFINLHTLRIKKRKSLSLV